MRPSETHPFIRFRRAWQLRDETWFQLGECKALIKAIQAAPLLPHYRAEIFEVSLIKGAQATTAIEGNTLSEEEIRQIQAGKSLSASKQYMEQEVRNVLDALNQVGREVLSDRLASLLTPRLIRDFHRLIGKDLGSHFEAVPGEFRRGSVMVGAVYRPPRSEEVGRLMDDFCEWSKTEFHYERGQTFSAAIIQAIVTHVYIAWIHPFGDGNGRTARLLEFYLLLRAGVPDVAAHILSNFYNETRAEYYRQLRNTSAADDLTDFIEYALRGFKDGLQGVLEKVQRSQLELAWRNLVQETFQYSADAGKTTPVIKRRMSLVLSLQLDEHYSETGLIEVNDAMRIEYSGRSRRTFERDLRALLELKLLVETEQGYRANTDLLRGSMAQSRPGQNPA